MFFICNQNKYSSNSIVILFSFYTYTCIANKFSLDYLVCTLCRRIHNISYDSIKQITRVAASILNLLFSIADGIVLLCDPRSRTHSCSHFITALECCVQAHPIFSTYDLPPSHLFTINHCNENIHPRFPGSDFRALDFLLKMFLIGSLTGINVVLVTL